MLTIPEPYKPLPGFEHSQRYWNAEQAAYVVKISPGEFYVTNNNEVIATTLGSCISACIYDKVNRIGGMNHFMLPAAVTKKTSIFDNEILSERTRYGNWAMEFLINEILKNGGVRKNLEVKIFGGGQVIKNTTAIGESNINFALKYIDNEGMKLISQDVGDIFPRKILYFPQTGLVKVKRLTTLLDNSIYQLEQTYLQNIKTKAVTGNIELF